MEINKKIEKQLGTCRRMRLLMPRWRRSEIRNHCTGTVGADCCAPQPERSSPDGAMRRRARSDGRRKADRGDHVTVRLHSISRRTSLHTTHGRFLRYRKYQNRLAGADRLARARSATTPSSEAASQEARRPRYTICLPSRRVRLVPIRLQSAVDKACPCRPRASCNIQRRRTNSRPLPADPDD